MDTERRNRGYKRGHHSSPAFFMDGNVIDTSLLSGVKKVVLQISEQSIRKVSVDNDEVLDLLTLKSNSRWNIQTTDERRMQKIDKTNVW